ncbi:formimidoylglutamase [Mesobacillus foraminis]|uniref:formimidoylglutamase n=1 Tax=Mesobacillus foraminis TaxID=279826 RepID=UPI0039A031CE
MDKFSFLHPGMKSHFSDRFVTRISDCLVWYKKGMSGDVGLIGLPASKSSITPSHSSGAPQTIRSCLNSYTTYSGERSRDYKDLRILDFGDVRTHPTDLDETISRLYISVKEMLEVRACERYVLLGGDHGVSYPAIRAFQEHYGTVGVIQWDAHHDVRNLEDGGRTNGTPFRSLVESGHLKGDHLVQVGIRDFSNAMKYHEFAKDHGIKVYTMGDVEQNGIVPIVKKEVERLSKITNIIYLSVDMDAADQAFAPGCPAIGPGGLTSRELLASVSEAAKHEKVKAMDIVEVDPAVDFRDMTSRLAAHVMVRFLFS